MGSLMLSSIGSVSNIYPAGNNPKSATVPPVWTATGQQPTAVQFNRVVYVKTDAYGLLPQNVTRGKPNEEEVDGVRTWRPMPNAPGKSDPYRYYWEHSHSALRSHATRAELMPAWDSPMPINDQDVYPGFVSGYFTFRNRFNDQTETRVASENQFPYSDVTPAHRKLVKRDFPVGLDWQNYSPGGMFSIYAQSLPIKIWDYDYGTESWYLKTLTERVLGYPISGWQSPPPFYEGEWPPPPADPEISVSYPETIDAIHPDQVGLTYSGYREVLTSQGYWQLIEGADPNLPESYEYKYGAVTVSQQIPMSYTVTQQDYVRRIDGDPAIYETKTHTISGGQDIWKSFGYTVLQSVTSWAD